MATYVLRNEVLEVSFNSHGAELICLKDVKSGNNYVWDGRPEFWARHSPVLFPLVGSLKEKQYAYKGVKYSMKQHGFARDMEFRVREQTDDTIWFVLEETKETMAMYPFNFTLEIGYQLKHRALCVMWKVINKGQDDMYFSIGAHPAFVCPIVPNTKRDEYFIKFDGVDRLTYRLLNQDGLAQSTINSLETAGGIIPFDRDLFSKDALVFENHQAQEVSLLTKDKVPYVSVRFSAPVFGVWTPTRGDAPFICIEPWYGRCDAENFSGDLEEREWGNHLGKGECFQASYEIEVFEIG